jgi:CRISPR/Cas system-associated protein Csm6
MRLKDRLAKLIDVKTIVTFALTATFVYLSITGGVKPEIFMTIYTMVVSFYFGTQHEKNKKE